MNLIEAHPAVFTIAAYWIFSALVGGMPAPTTTSNAGYQWAYASLHILAGNLVSAFQARYPTLSGGTTTEKTERTVTIPPPPPGK